MSDELDKLGTDDLILRHGSNIYLVDSGDIDEDEYNRKLDALLAEAKRRDTAVAALVDACEACFEREEGVITTMRFDVAWDRLRAALTKLQDAPESPC